MPKYTGSHYLIDRKEPSKLFLQARNIAGSIIESQFKKFKALSTIFLIEHPNCPFFPVTKIFIIN